MPSATQAPDIEGREPLRVLHIVTSSAFAGTERHVLYLARGLRALGCAAELACPPSAVRLRAEAAAAGVRSHPARSRERTWLGTLVRDIARIRPDVVHVHDGRGAVAAALLGPLAGGLLVRTQHFTRPASLERTGLRGSASLRLHRTLNRKVDGYICVSESVADGARERRETRSADVAVIPPGIVLPSRGALAAAQSARATMSQTVVAFAGRLEPERRLDVLLKAITGVVAQMPGCHFVLAGTGSAERELKSLASQLRIQDAVTWKGWVDDPYALLERAHLYVNPAPWEGFGMAMAEAMAIGLPVVAVDSGASSNMIESGVTGCLVPAGDVAALCRAIVRLGSDRAQTAFMGQAAHERAASLYGAPRTAQVTLTLYRQLLAGARS